MPHSLVLCVCVLFHHKIHKLVLASLFFPTLKTRFNATLCWTVNIDYIVPSLEFSITYRRSLRRSVSIVWPRFAHCRLKST